MKETVEYNNPIVRYEIFDRMKGDFLKEEPSTIEDIVKLLYEEEQLKDKLLQFSKCMTFQAIELIEDQKNVMITPVRQISTIISNSNHNYSITSVEVTLNNKNKTNKLNICPIEIDGELISRISFCNDNQIIYKYFNNVGKIIHNPSLISKEIYINRVKDNIKSSIIKQYDFCDNLISVIINGLKYIVTYSIVRPRLNLGNKKVEISVGDKCVITFLTNNKNISKIDIDSITYNKIIEYHFK